MQHAFQQPSKHQPSAGNDFFEALSHFFILFLFATRLWQDVEYLRTSLAISPKDASACTSMLALSYYMIYILLPWSIMIYYVTSKKVLLCTTCLWKFLPESQCRARVAMAGWDWGEHVSCKVGMNTPRVAHVGVDTLAFQSPGERPREKHVGKFGATVCLDWTVGSLGTDRNAEKTGTYYI